MGFLAAQSDYKARVAENDFEATEAELQQADYANAIQQSQQAAMGGTAAQGQDALAKALMAQARGEGPSLAQGQLQQATQQMQAQAAGAMVSQRGLNPALATRLIAQNQAAMSQQAAGQSAQLRLQEQLGAQGQLAQALSAQRGQDIQTLGTAGGLQQGQNA
jgi:hypothetical protein